MWANASREDMTLIIMATLIIFLCFTLTYDIQALPLIALSMGNTKC